MSATAKSLIWLGDSREAVRDFPDRARRSRATRIGFQLWRVQCGLQPNDWKPIRSVGSGVQKIRIHTDGEHRVSYMAKLPEAVYVIHAFEKRTWRTPRRDLDLAKERLRVLLAERARREGMGR